VRFATVILAAGASVRMGRPKLLLPWGKKTILAHLVEQWTELSAAQIAIVVEQGSEVDARVRRMKAERVPVNIEHPTSNIERPPVEVVINPRPALGMWSSVQCAARWPGWKDVTHFVITLGDQPHVGSATLKVIMNFAEENAKWICEPARKGRGRHPVVFPSEIFREIAEEDTSPRPSPRSGEGEESKTLKDFLRAHKAKRKMFESDDPALDLDIDTPADYESALKLCNL